MTFSGMTPEQIEECASGLRRQADELNNTRGHVSALVREASAHWNGRDVQTFSAVWNSSYAPRMSAAIATLSRMADQLIRQAADQRAASQAEPVLSPHSSPTLGPVVPTPLGPTQPEQSPTYSTIENAVRDALAKELADAGLSPEEQEKAIETISQLIDKAPEPWKSLYLKNLDKLNIVHDDGVDNDWILPFDDDKTNYYQPINDSVHVDLSSDATDSRGPFYTLFHELGHGIDDKEDFWGMATPGYTIDGKDLDDVLRDDVRTSITKQITKYSGDSAQQSRIVEAIMNQKTDKLSAADKGILTKLQAYYDQVLAGPNANVASDIYGAMTGNVLGGSSATTWGHPDNYWDSAGNNASKEFWAGYCADQIEQNNGLSVTQNMFPTAFKFADQMAKELAS